MQGSGVGGSSEDRASEATLLQGVARASQATFRQGAVLSPTLISPSDEKHSFLVTVQGIDKRVVERDSGSSSALWPQHLPPPSGLTVPLTCFSSRRTGAWKLNFGYRVCE